MAARVFLILSALIWTGYGLVCFANPGYLAEAAGVAAGTATGRTELRAMYGGLQIAIGTLALAGALRPAAAPVALLVLASVAAGLGTARLAGVALDGGFSSYTAAALAIEFGTLALATWLRHRTLPSAVAA